MRYPSIVFAALASGLGCAPGTTHPAQLQSAPALSARALETTGGAGPSPTTETVAQLRALQIRQMTALWNRWTGISGGKFAKPTIDAEEDVLTQKTTIQGLRQGLNLAPRSTLEARLVALRAARRIAPIEADLHRRIASMTVAADGREVRWLEAHDHLAREPSALRRRALWLAMASTATALETPLIESRIQFEAALDEVGWSSEDLVRATSADSLRDPLDGMNDVLAQTEVEWRDVLTKTAALTIKLPLDKVTYADFPRMEMGAGVVDSFFSKDGNAARVTALLARGPRDGTAGWTVLTHVARTTGLPALAVNLSTPSQRDVRAYVPGGAGVVAYLANVSAVATALAAWKQPAPSPDEPSNRAVFADGAAAAIAQAALHLVPTRKVVPAHAGDTQAPQLVTDSQAADAALVFSFHTLLKLRIAAARLQCSISGEDSDPESYCQKDWQAALGIPVSRHEARYFWATVESFPRTYGQLRAAVVGRRIYSHFVEQFGPTWITSDDAWRALELCWRNEIASCLPLQAPSHATTPGQDGGAPRSPQNLPSATDGGAP